MTVQLRISSSKEQRSTIYRGNTRRLLRLSDVPDSPTSSGAVCEAVESDGQACWVALKESAGDIWCYQHHDEWRQLNIHWAKIHTDAERMTVTGLDAGKQKILKLRQSVDLRREIQERFYPRGGDIQDYIEWINKMENDVRQLADSLLSKSQLSKCTKMSTNTRQWQISTAAQPQRPQVSIPLRLIQTAKGRERRL